MKLPRTVAIVARPDRFFLAAGLLFGVAMVAATAPFQAPDEPVHFYRSFAVSEGQLTAETRQGRTGAMLPSSLAALADLFAGVTAHPERRIDPEIFSAARRIALEDDVRSFLDFPNSAVMSPLPYLPQAAAVAAGRSFGASPLTLLYLARLANLLAAAVLIHAGLRQLPAYRWLAAAIALTPMAVFLRSSASADPVTFATAFLFVATVARLAFGAKETIRRRDAILLGLSAAVICLTKAVYVPLTVAVAAIPARRLPRGWGRVALLAYAATVAAAFFLAVATARSVETPLRPGIDVDPQRQLAGVLLQPWRFLEVAGVDYLRHGGRYAAEAVGRLGWLNIPLPSALLVSYLVFLCALLLLDTRSDVVVAGWQRWILATVTIATALLISASVYVTYTPPGASFIEGIQGRYFLPVAPAAVWIFHRRSRAAAATARALAPSAAMFSTLALAVTLVVLIQRYDL